MKKAAVALGQGGCFDWKSQYALARASKDVGHRPRVEDARSTAEGEGRSLHGRGRRMEPGGRGVKRAA
jgi:hypothetical protein